MPQITVLADIYLEFGAVLVVGNRSRCLGLASGIESKFVSARQNILRGLIARLESVHRLRPVRSVERIVVQLQR